MEQVKAISLAMSVSKGMVTYRTSWKAYDKWHSERFGVAAPRCPYTGLLWLNREMGTRFTSSMAVNKKTSAQVSRSITARVPLPAARSPATPNYSLLPG